MSATTPHRTSATPSSRPTFTPCTRMNNLSLNSHSGTNRTKVMNCHQQAFDISKRIAEVAVEEDDTPEHPNLTMVLGPQKISFDQLMDYPPRHSLMQLSDDDDSDEEINETSNTFSPCRMSLSPDRGFPQPMSDIDDEVTKDTMISSPLLLNKKLTRNNQHYDPNFSISDGIYEDGDDETTYAPPILDLTSMSSTHNAENVAPEEWLKYFSPSVIDLKKSPASIDNNNYYSNRSNTGSKILPLQEITVKHNIPLILDEIDEQPARHTKKKKVVGDRFCGMRMMRSLSPTKEDMRKGKEPITNSTPSTSSSTNNNKSSSTGKHIDASIAFFL